MPDYRLPALDGADAFGRARENQVARLQRKQRRQVGDGLADRPDHVAHVAFLLRYAVDLQADGGLADVGNVGGPVQLAYGGREVEGLADFPWAAGVLHLALQVAARHVEADRITEDVAGRVVDGDVRAALADGDHQLALEVEVGRRGRERQLGRGARRHRHDGVGVARFAEEERRFTIRVRAHFTGMAGVVAADAVDAAHGKAGVDAGDGQAGRLVRREDEVRAHDAP